MATELYDKQGTLVTLERMKKEYDLSDDIMKDLYDIVEDEERCKEILEHGPYATIGDGKKAIGAALGAVGSYGIMKGHPLGTKSMKELYNEQLSWSSARLLIDRSLVRVQQVEPNKKKVILWIIAFFLLLCKQQGSGVPHPQAMPVRWVRFLYKI